MTKSEMQSERPLESPLLFGRSMKTILLVNDDPHDVAMMSDLLSHAGYHVITRFDAETALLVIQEIPKLDLVITD